VFAPVTDRHKLDISVVGNGNVGADPGESTYANGTEVELTAVADPGWSFVDWTFDLTGDNNSENIIMDDDKTVTATFSPGILVDSEFNDSADSEYLRFNSTSQDWYESRVNYPELLILDVANIGGNNGKKAGIEGRDMTNFVYLTQEFSSPQSDNFNVSLDIYIDVMNAYFYPDLNRYYNRTAHIYMGDDNGGTSGPCSSSSERFIYLAFYDSTPGDSGDDLELRARENSSQSWHRTHEWTQVANGLSYDAWYTIKIMVNVSGGLYDIYINDVLKKDNISGYTDYASSSVKHISFYGGGTGRGNFFVDNVLSPAVKRYTLDINVIGNGSVNIDPGESTYANGTVVELAAIPDPGWSFAGWSGDLTGNTNPESITMTDEMMVTANFVQDEYTLTVNTDGNGFVNVDPVQIMYLYGDVVELNASADPGWAFTHWTGDLTGSKNPATITMAMNKTVTAHFSEDAIYTFTIDIDGSGSVVVDPDWAVYLPNEVVELNATGNSGWSFSHWSGNLTGSTNPTNIIMTSNKTIAASFNSSIPTVQTMNITDISNTTATLRGNLTDDGGENCSVWFEYGEHIEGDDCIMTIATGTVCKDGKSIIHKNRHASANNQKPYFYQGTNYSYFGVGSAYGMCRMGQNEKGLALVNVDVYYNMDNWEYQSDGGPYVENPGYDDSDFHVVLGNYSTVRDAAMYLALHGNYGGKSGQYLIISSEPGVGAIVGVDPLWHTNITWINNTYAATAQGWYCDGDIDHGDYNDVRAKEIMDDIVNNGNSSDGDNLLNWQDIAQRIAKDTSDKEDGEGSFYFGNDISKSSSRAASVHVAGNSSLNSSLHMSWLAFGQTTQVGIFLPIYAGNLHCADDIHSNFTNDNGGNGIHPYVTTKQNYAQDDLPNNYYYCDRVREIQQYAFFNENITFDRFEDIMASIMFEAANEDEARSILAEYVNDTVPRALHGYINNLITFKTNRELLEGVGTFNDTVTYLDPGAVYYSKAWANNSAGTSNGTKVLFLTEPNIPVNVQVFNYSESQMNLTWIKGTGALYTIIERNMSSDTKWERGEGIEIYNGTDNRYEDTGLAPNTRYYYQLWSFTSDSELHQYSSNYASIYTPGKPASLLVDSRFNECINSVDLRTNSTNQDWYESRNDYPTLLTLNTSDVGGNSGKKAALKNYNISSNAYLTQEFSSPQDDIFNISFDVYIDKIADDSTYDRSGFIFIGDDSQGTNGPCSTSSERFVLLTFYDSTPGGSGDDLELRAREFRSDHPTSPQPWALTSSWTQIATDLIYDTWYHIRIDCDVSGGTYDVYVNDVLEGDDISKYEEYSSSSVTYISFPADDRAKGDIETFV